MPPSVNSEGLAAESWVPSRPTESLSQMNRWVDVNVMWLYLCVYNCILLSVCVALGMFVGLCTFLCVFVLVFESECISVCMIV